MKIDHETCPVNARVIQKIGERLWEYVVSEWSPGGLVCVRAVRANAVPEWYTAEELEARVVEILPASPAIPTLPGPWLDAWPSEIPDGSKWFLDSTDGPGEQFIAYMGSLWDGKQRRFIPIQWRDGMRIRRVG